MAGRFTHLLEGKGVTGVTGVTIDDKAGYINDLDVTLPQQNKNSPDVTRVTNASYTASTVKEKCNPPSVTEKPRVSAGSSGMVTPITPLHQRKGEVYFLQYQERITHELHFTRNRKQAENLAYQEIVLRWIHDHPLPIAEGICAGCSKPITAGQESIAYGGILTHWHGGDLSKGMHCSKRYIDSRRKEAETALAAMGIVSHD